MKPVTRTLSQLDAQFPLGDEQPMDEQQAAGFLGTTSGTLDTYRREGGGPVFVKFPPAGGRKGQNTTVVYILGDLRAWRDKHKREANYGHTPAVMSWETLDDTRRPEPWFQAEGRLTGHALSSDIPSKAQVVWASLEEAVLDLPWTSGEQRTPWVDEYQAAVKLALDMAQAAQDKFELLSILGDRGR